MCCSFNITALQRACKNQKHTCTRAHTVYNLYLSFWYDCSVFLICPIFSPRALTWSRLWSKWWKKLEPNFVLQPTYLAHSRSPRLPLYGLQIKERHPSNIFIRSLRIFYDLDHLHSHPLLPDPLFLPFPTHPTSSPLFSKHHVLFVPSMHSWVWGHPPQRSWPTLGHTLIEIWLSLSSSL